MAKRSRVAGRPGQRRPLQKAGARPSSPPSRPAGSVTPEEEARAAELEARILAEEKAAEAAARKTSTRGRQTEVGLYTSAPLAVRAAEEYAYVRRDVRRIVIVGGLLLGVMAVLYVLVNVANVL
jgi:hypothetical protein